jgi:hypothetical protein
MNLRYAALVANAVLAAHPGVASAQGQVFNLPAGIGCEFELTIAQTQGNLMLKEFKDQNGNTIRFLQAGKGYTLVFTNEDTGKTYTLPTPGSVTSVRINPDGTQTVTLTGHNVFVLFPTDVPAGPSTILYTGRLLYTVDKAGVSTVQSFNGRTKDICSELRA